MTTNPSAPQHNNNLLLILLKKKWSILVTGMTGLVLGLGIAFVVEESHVAESILIPPTATVLSKMMPQALPDPLGLASATHEKLTSSLLMFSLFGELKRLRYLQGDDFGENLDRRLNIETGEDNSEITIRYRREATQNQVVDDLKRLVQRANKAVLVGLQEQFEQHKDSLVQEAQNRIESGKSQVGGERMQKIVHLLDEKEKLLAILNDSGDRAANFEGIILSSDSDSENGVQVPLHLLNRDSLDARLREVGSLVAQLQSNEDVSNYVEAIPAMKARQERVRATTISMVSGSAFRYERPPTIDKAATSPKPLLLALAGLLTGCLAGVLAAVVATFVGRQNHES
jgi:LPS O-antigen subunit length determinant protein (WzzB/FepE family)